MSIERLRMGYNVPSLTLPKFDKAGIRVLVTCGLKKKKQKKTQHF
jgi:hypothetical protein